MLNLESRLQKCFATVFPDLPKAEIPSAVLDGTRQWDSVATVILVTVLEEEFSIQINPNDYAKLTSYSSISDYIQARTADAEIVG